MNARKDLGLDRNGASNPFSILRGVGSTFRGRVWVRRGSVHVQVRLLRLRQ